VSGFVGASVSYVDNRKGSFPGFFSAATQRETLPAYVQTDVRGGIRYDSWTINLFINNLTDERGVLSRGLEKSDPNLYNFIQPRTAGISLVKTFK
jgi:outer membrane receptor protein involved in Fe transport